MLLGSGEGLEEGEEYDDIDFPALLRENIGQEVELCEFEPICCRSCRSLRGRLSNALFCLQCCLTLILLKCFDFSGLEHQSTTETSGATHSSRRLGRYESRSTNFDLICWTL
jgi:hypothetical protein